MSAAYLQQCGEDATNRTGFSLELVWERHASFPIGVLTSSSGNFSVVKVETEFSVPTYWMTEIEMIPGWWTAEAIGYRSDVGDFMSTFGGFWWKPVSEYSSYPPTWGGSLSGWTFVDGSAGGLTISEDELSHWWTENPIVLLNDEVPCKRIAILLKSTLGTPYPPLAGVTRTERITGTFLACPNCPEPI